jgi:cysteine synthase A
MSVDKSESVIQQIGNTPLIRLSAMVEPGWADVYVKMESYNPGGSVKDRICLAMIEAAEQSGALKPVCR